jgi:hypothetical protein
VFRIARDPFRRYKLDSRNSEASARSSPHSVAHWPVLLGAVLPLPVGGGVLPLQTRMAVMIVLFEMMEAPLFSLNSRFKGAPAWAGSQAQAGSSP